MKLYKTITLGLLAATLAACGNGNKKYDATGTFEATEVIVSSEASGRVLELKAFEGSLVDANIQLGIIDTTQLYLKKMQLKANSKTINSKRWDIGKQIAATQQQIATQQREKKRWENLVRSNSANQKQVDDINAQIDFLYKQLTAQRTTLENNNMGISSESSAIEIQIAQINDLLSKCYIMSPIKGTILSKYIEKGELAVPGKALFKVADLDNMFLRAYVTSNQLSKIKLNQPVTVYADYGGNNIKEYSGTVAWISTKSEFTPKGIQTNDERANLVYAVKIAINNDGLVKIGMYGEVSFNK